MIKIIWIIPGNSGTSGSFVLSSPSPVAFGVSVVGVLLFSPSPPSSSFVCLYLPPLDLSPETLSLGSSSCGVADVSVCVDFVYVGVSFYHD